MKRLPQLADRVPEHWTVIVLSDRGLYAPWLYTRIVSLGWHPFMRINTQGHFRPKGDGQFRSLATAAPEVGSAWCGKVDCFSQETSRLQCTLLARWDEGYEEVWLIVTDLAPAQATAAWYGMRSWIEIVQPQMTKTDVLTPGGGGDHIADLHLLCRHDDPIDEQFDELAFLLKGSLSQSLLHSPTKGFD